jgi:chromatin remodeling complex protein RSC6
MTGKGSALKKKVQLSPQFADFFGVSTMTRGDFTKAVWEVINEYKEDSFPITLPSELAKLFGIKKISKASDVMKLQKKAFIKE